MPTPRFLEECHGNVIKKLFRVKKLWPPNKTPKDIKYVEKMYVLTLQNHKLEFELQTHGRGVRELLDSNVRRSEQKLENAREVPTKLINQDLQELMKAQKHMGGVRQYASTRHQVKFEVP